MPTIKRKFVRTNPKVDSNLQKDRAAIYRTARWRKLRALKLAADPLCEQCLEEGRTVVSSDVHHKVSFMSTDDPVRRKYLAYDFDNLQSLCKQCHQKIHNYDKKEVGV